MHRVSNLFEDRWYADDVAAKGVMNKALLGPFAEEAAAARAFDAALLRVHGPTPRALQLLNFPAEAATHPGPPADGSGASTEHTCDGCLRVRPTAAGLRTHQAKCKEWLEQPYSQPTRRQLRTTSDSPNHPAGTSDAGSACRPGYPGKG